MTPSRRLIFLTVVALALGLSACEQQTSTDSNSASPRSDRGDQSSPSQPGQGGGSAGSDTQRSTNPAGDRP